MKKAMCMLSLPMLIAGCATPLTPDQIANADYGPPMPPEACIAVAEKFIRSTLKDPASAQFEHAKTCSKNGMRKSLINGGSWSFGYLQEGLVNAKNAYGGYVGFRPYKAIINNGAVVEYCMVTDARYGICE